MIAPGNNSFLRLGWLLFALVLAGCAGNRIEVSETEREIAWAERQVLLQTIDSWNLRARTVITVDEAVYSVGLGWKRQQDSFTMLLEAPFGQGVFKIESDPRYRPRYTLLYPDGQALRGQSPEALLQQAIGWALPVSGMHYWMVGLPRPDSSHQRELDGGGKVSRLTQDGWNITYQDFFSEAPKLPRKLLLEREQVRLRVVVDSWQPRLPGPDRNSEIFPEFN